MNDDKVKAVTEEQAAIVGKAVTATGAALGEAGKRFGADVVAALAGLGKALDDATGEVKAAKTEDAPVTEPKPESGP